MIVCAKYRTWPRAILIISWVQTGGLAAEKTSGSLLVRPRENIHICLGLFIEDSENHQVFQKSYISMHKDVCIYIYIHTSPGQKSLESGRPSPMFTVIPSVPCGENNTIYVCMYIYILSSVYLYIPRDPCMVDLQFTYICFFLVNVDKYTMTMDPMGIGLHRYHIRIPTARIFAAITTSSQPLVILTSKNSPPVLRLHRICQLTLENNRKDRPLV